MYIFNLLSFHFFIFKWHTNTIGASQLSGEMYNVYQSRIKLYTRLSKCWYFENPVRWLTYSYDASTVEFQQISRISQQSKYFLVCSVL